MFLSAFISATIFPANSEIIFTSFASANLLNPLSHFSDLFFLVIIATLGNTLGSLTVYWLGKFIPSVKFKQNSSYPIHLALGYSQKYGIWCLLFSWLPIIGDLFCGIAGWLGFHFWKSALFIAMGKAARYSLLLWGIYAVVG
ncbi:membrane protein YqaA with SNARE-associated domain [Nicoletella semolina]|uniref:Membrane protein YqaA with SNARE-associated domain n=2 Tax=Nicoletella semolina TaxID=271160 RepID=A0A4R2NCB0_9PAST|nr:membrane protein YqaA with SNARE-associated domain [Nicoletella semolina]